jgi:hypothetical protein
MELKTRRIVHAGVTKFPTNEWTAQQLREATPWGKVLKYLIRDRDGKYGNHFSAVGEHPRVGDTVSHTASEWILRKVHGEPAARMSGSYFDP